MLGREVRVASAGKGWGVLEQFLGVSPLELLLIWTATAAAAVLRAFTGFGFALAAVPVYAFFMLPAEAVVLSASLALMIGIQTFPHYREQLDPGRQWPVFVLAIPGTVLGAALLQQLAVDEFRLAIGVLTIIASLVLARYRPGSRTTGPRLAAAAGFVSGLMNGGFAVPGPPVVIYAMATEADPARSRAFMIGFFTFASILALAAFGWLGMLSKALACLALVAYPGMLLGDRLGYHLFKRYAGARYRGIAVATCLAIGVAICARSLL